MATAKFNSSFKPLRGKVGGLVFKHYVDKVVVTRAPTFSGQWSTGQQDGRKRFALASAYARTVQADPVLRAKYEKIAARRGLTVRSAVISAFLQGKTRQIEGPPPVPRVLSNRTGWGTNATRLAIERVFGSRRAKRLIGAPLLKPRYRARPDPPWQVKITYCR